MAALRVLHVDNEPDRASGPDALEVVETWPPAAMPLDLMMPIINAPATLAIERKAAVKPQPSPISISPRHPAVKHSTLHGDIHAEPR